MISRSDRDDAAGGNRYTFERGKRRGQTYDLGLTVCASPVCHCTNLHLRCTSGESPEDRTPPFRYDVTLDVFKRKWLKYGSGDRASRSFGRDLARDCNAEDWAKLRQHFLKVKLQMTNDADLASLDHADFPHDEIEGESLLIAYQQIVPFDQSLRVEADGERFLIEDLYCVKSPCPCRDMRLAFLPIPRDAPADQIYFDDPASETSVVFDLGRGRWQVKEQGKVAVSGTAMMRAFIDQLRPRAILKERRRVLRAMYRNYLRRIGWTAVPSATGEKIGRNAPCPCGSGKKYKRCCLSKELGR